MWLFFFLFSGSHRLKGESSSRKQLGSETIEHIKKQHQPHQLHIQRERGREREQDKQDIPAAGCTGFLALANLKRRRVRLGVEQEVGWEQWVRESAGEMDKDRRPWRGWEKEREGKREKCWGPQNRFTEGDIWLRRFEINYLRLIIIRYCRISRPLNMSINCKGFKGIFVLGTAVHTETPSSTLHYWLTVCLSIQANMGRPTRRPSGPSWLWQDYGDSTGVRELHKSRSSGIKWWDQQAEMSSCACCSSNGGCNKVQMMQSEYFLLLELHLSN